MPINGLMLTLAPDDLSKSGVMEALHTRPEVEQGELQNRWLPLVVDAPDARVSREIHAWLEGLPGVQTVDVILAGLDP